MLTLPDDLKRRELSEHWNQPIDRLPPDSISEIQFSGKSNLLLKGLHFPIGLKILFMNHWYKTTFEGVQWPNGIESLHLSGWNTFNEPLLSGHLPSSLTHLSLPRAFSCRMDQICLPWRLISLTLSRFDHPLDHSMIWPETLRYLDLGDLYFHPLPPGALPSYLTILKLSEKWNFSLTDDHLHLPPSLKVLYFGSGFRQVFTGYQFPSDLVELHFPSVTQGKPKLLFHEIQWPLTLHTLILPESVLSNPTFVTHWPPRLKWLHFDELVMFGEFTEKQAKARLREEMQRNIPKECIILGDFPWFIDRTEDLLRMYT